MPGEVKRWTLSVSADTDFAVREYLARHGMTDADLPGFIEEAVRWRVFDATLTEARAGFDDLADGELASLVDEAVRAVRGERNTPPR